MNTFKRHASFIRILGLLLVSASLITPGCSVTTADNSPMLLALLGSVEPPAAPVNFRVFPVNNGAIIRFNPVDGASWYRIYMKDSAGVLKTDYTLRRTAGATDYAWTGLTNGTEYYFIVTASNLFEGDASVEKSCIPVDREMAADTNTIALWHLNDLSGQLCTDSSANGYDLNLGVADFVEANIEPTRVEMDIVPGEFPRAGLGMGLLFDGSTYQRLIYPAISNHFTGTRSIELWLRGNTTIAAGLIAKIGPIILINDASGNITAIFYDYFTGDKAQRQITVTRASADFFNGSWHYLAVTLDDSTPSTVYIRFYYDGNYVTGQEFTSASLPASTMDMECIIGGVSDNAFSGYMDEIRISSSRRDMTTEIIPYYDRAMAL